MEIECRTFRPEDLPRVLALYRRIFKEERGEAEWRWKFAANPDGESLIMVAAHESGIVGHYGLTPRRFKVGDEVLIGYQEVDLMVDRSFSGRGIFQRLGELAYAAARERGSSFTFGFPNTRSLPVGTRKLGWKPVAPIPIRSCYLDLGARLPRGLGLLGRLGQPLLSAVSLRSPGGGRSKGLEVRPLERVPEEAEELWSELRAGFAVAGERGRAYLQWRYLDHPVRHYELLGAFRQGRLAGLTALRLDPPGEREVWILELLAEDAVAAAALLQRALLRAREQGAAVVKLWWLGDERLQGLLRGRLFLRRRAPFYHVIRPLGPPELMAYLERPDVWFVTLGDGDGI